MKVSRAPSDLWQFSELLLSFSEVGNIGITSNFCHPCRKKTHSICLSQLNFIFVVVLLDFNFLMSTCFLRYSEMAGNSNPAFIV